ncbi:MAG: UPF0175 family protein [Acidilobaceae archaeon]
MSVEISGLLERRARKLVELGLYGSVSEVVRDALRRYFETLDLKRVALDLYLLKDVSLSYAAEIAGLSYDEFLDYLLYRGVQPLLGVLSSSEVDVVEGELLLDPSSVHTIYKSRLAEVLPKTKDLEIDLLVPKQLEARVQALNALRVRLGLPAIPISSYVELDVDDQEEPKSITSLEKACVDYARKEGITLISDDIRVRSEATRNGTRTGSSLSILETLIRRNVFESEIEIAEVLYSLRAVPVLIPIELEERWLARK